MLKTRAGLWARRTAAHCDSSLLPSNSFHFPLHLLFISPFSISSSVEFTVKHSYAWTSFRITSCGSPHPTWELTLREESCLGTFAVPGLIPQPRENTAAVKLTALSKAYPAAPSRRPLQQLLTTLPSLLGMLLPAQGLPNLSVQMAHPILKRNNLPKLKNSHFFFFPLYKALA